MIKIIYVEDPEGRDAGDEGRGPRGICPGGAGHRVRR